MRVKFLAEGNNGGLLMGLELTTDRYPPITSQTRYPMPMLVSLQLAVVCNVLHGPGVQSRVLSRLPHVLPFGVVWDLGGGLVASFSNIPTYPRFLFSLCFH